MTTIVPPLAHHELVVVTGELQSGCHLAICQRPAAEQVVQVILTLLQENTYRLVFRLADQSRINMPATDIGEAAENASINSRIIII